MSYKNERPFLSAYKRHIKKNLKPRGSSEATSQQKGAGKDTFKTNKFVVATRSNEIKNRNELNNDHTVVTMSDAAKEN